MKQPILNAFVQKTIESSAAALSHSDAGIRQLQLLEQLLTIRAADDSSEGEIQPLVYCFNTVATPLHGVKRSKAFDA